MGIFAPYIEQFSKMRMAISDFWRCKNTVFLLVKTYETMRKSVKNTGFSGVFGSFRVPGGAARVSAC